MQRGEEVLEAGAIARRLGETLPHWRFAEGAILRVFRTQGWKATLMVANAVGHLAEVAWHHPDLALSYDRVEVRLSTHSAKGVTEKDLALAAKIEEVVAWFPGGQDGPLEGPPEDSRHAILKRDDA